MSAEEQIVYIQNRITEKVLPQIANRHVQALYLLRKLHGIDVNLKLLAQTGIGITVNKLRKSTKHEPIITLAWALINKWKKCLTSRRKAINTKNKMNKKFCISKKERAQKKQIKIQVTNTMTPSTDPVRIKSKALLAAAIGVEVVGEAFEGYPTPEELADELEDCIYLEFKNIDRLYKNRVRSRIANLKDVNNPKLRANFRVGAIDASQLAVMTPEEMASDHMKRIRESFIQEAIHNAQLAILN